jgi:outer membrane lipoprotein-sorting protein
MKSIISLVLLTLSFSLSTLSQQDPAAKEVLDKFTRKAEADYPIRIEFEYIYESVIDKETFMETGELILNGNQYRLIFRDSEIYCNGTLMWNYLVSEDEVYISEPENFSENDEFFLTNPEKLFSFYDENFKYRLTGEFSHLDIDYYQVDLFPVELNKSYHTISLLIRQDNYRLYSLGTKGKQGVNHTFTITSYQAKYKTNPGTFQFDPSQHPELEVIDTRL